MFDDEKRSFEIVKALIVGNYGVRPFKGLPVVGKHILMIDCYMSIREVRVQDFLMDKGMVTITTKWVGCTDPKKLGNIESITFEVPKKIKDYSELELNTESLALFDIGKKNGKELIQKLDKDIEKI